MSWLCMFIPIGRNFLSKWRNDLWWKGVVKYYLTVLSGDGCRDLMERREFDLSVIIFPIVCICGWFFVTIGVRPAWKRVFCWDAVSARSKYAGGFVRWNLPW